MKITREFVRDGKTVAVTAEFLEGDRWRVRIGDTVHEYEAKALGDGGVKLQSLGEGVDRAFVAYGASLAKGYMVRVDGRTVQLCGTFRRPVNEEDWSRINTDAPILLRARPAGYFCYDLDLSSVPRTPPS